MQSFRHALVPIIVGIAALALSGCADDRLATHAVNNLSEGWYTWGKVKNEVVQDPAAPGGKFQRISVPVIPAEPWEDGVVVTVTQPVKKGDVVVFAFWARADVLPAGDDFIQLSGRVSEQGPPVADMTPETTFLISRKWQLFHASGTAGKDFAAGKSGGAIVIGGDVQTIDFGPVYISDFGPGFDVSKLRELKAAERP